MSFCKKCGFKLQSGDLFCSSCGTKLVDSARKSILKCPNCAEISESFTSHCKLCGYEFRNTDISNALREFKEKLSEFDKPKSNSGRYQYRYINQSTDTAEYVKTRKINIISTFPIPNTREDIMEFMILACGNFDDKYYLSHLSEEDISDAWLSKIKQCYEKAKLILAGEDFKKIEDLYHAALKKIGEYRPQEKKSIFGKIFKRN